MGAASVRALITVVIAAAASLCGCSQPQARSYRVVRLAPSCSKEHIALTIVGDSLARGWGASDENSTFAALVYADVKRRYPKTSLHNLGIPGATTNEIATREVSHIAIERCSLIVIISGANDVQKLYSPNRFRESYQKLLTAIRARIPGAGYQNYRKTRATRSTMRLLDTGVPSCRCTHYLAAKRSARARC
jgi:lysophospholipase L1-like esterase